MVALLLRTSNSPQPDFLALPWSTPLEHWPDEMAVRLPRGRHRHVVRFIEHEDRYFAFKELPPKLAMREYEILSKLNEDGFPAVKLVGVAHSRIGDDGEPLESVLITRHLSYAVPYLHLFAGNAASGMHIKLVDALVILLVRLHLEGLYWGDCSLGNALFRRDAGALVAYLVDTETSEWHDELSDGQRQHDLDIAVENILGGLFELEVKNRLPEAVDPVEVVELLAERYHSLWAELTSTTVVDPVDTYVINERLNRLNELGFDTTEMELVTTEGSGRILFRPAVVEEGHHRRKLEQLTGIHAEENQARRLLSALRSYTVWLANESGREVPEAVGAYRWLTERYEPTVARVPVDMRAKLTDAELYHQVLEHNWFLSERAGKSVDIKEAVDDYVATVLTKLPDEVAVIENAAAVPSGTVGDRAADPVADPAGGPVEDTVGLTPPA